MKKRLLLIVIALLALVSGAQAYEMRGIIIYDGKEWKPGETEFGFEMDLATLQVIANVERKWNLEVSGNVHTFKDLSGNTLFSINVKEKSCSVPADVVPFGMYVKLSAASKAALRQIDPFYAEYNNIQLYLNQEVNSKTFPDQQFHDYIIHNICKPDPNGLPTSKLKAEDIENVYSINTGNGTIKNLKGIGLFPNLITLDCSHNQITSLDLSKNTKLVKLHCQDNKLTSLKVNSNSLNEIYCYGNNISGSNMDALISSLPTRSNGTFWVKYPSYVTTGIDNEMTCKQVSNAIKKGWVPKCEGTGADYLGSDFVCRINSANFEDYQFQIYVRTYFDLDNNDMLDQSEIANVTTMGVSNKDFWSLKGIEYFTSLRKLVCDGNKLTSLDLRSNKSLTELRCQNNQLNSLNVSGLKNLQTLLCNDNNLTSLDLSTCTDLAFLYCENNLLSSLKMQGGSTKLSYVEVYCFGNKLSGSNMTTFVNSLPTSETVGRLRVKKNEASAGNQMTTAQINIAKEKAWKVMIWDGSDWVDYSGSDGIAINQTNFPDAIFRNWLMNQDYGRDGILTKTEIAGVTSIVVSSLGIANLKGIEFFTALKWLHCEENQLEALDVTNNTMLERLYCRNNKLTSLNVMKNTALTDLDCSDNQLEILDARRNTALTDLNCERNKLVSLLVSTNHRSLQMLSCHSNSLKGAGMASLINSMPTLTVNNDTPNYFMVYNNSSTDNVITTSQVKAAKAKGWRVTTPDGNDYAGVNGITIDETNFPDPNFRSWVRSRYGRDGLLTEDEIAGVKEPYLHSQNIASLKGIEYFTAVTILYCQGNKLTELDVSGNLELVSLYCENNQLTSLDLSNNTKLNRLECYGNKIRGEGMTTLVNSLRDISYEEGNGILKVCSNEAADGNEITTVQVKTAANKYWSVFADNGSGWQNYAGLEVGIAIDETHFPDPNFRAWVLEQEFGADGFLTDDEIPEITEMEVSFRDIVSLKGIEYFTALTSLYCYFNSLKTLDVSKNTALEHLACDNNQLSTLDVSKNTALTGLNIENNGITEIDVTKNTALTFLNCGNNQLTTIDVSNNPALTYFYFHNNQINGVGMNALVKSLPIVENGYLLAYGGDGVDGNRMTVAQVWKATNKGWTVQTMDGEDYEGFVAAGDADGNGRVDVIDLEVIRKLVLGTEPSGIYYQRGADMNGDGTVNIVDLTLLIKYLGEK